MKVFGFNVDIRRASKQEISQVTAYSNGGRLMLASREYPMLLSAVYRCVDLISDTIGVLPLETYLIDSEGFKTEHNTHPAYDILNIEPNEDMTRYIFFKVLMTSVLLTGNGYAYIERDEKLNVKQLVYIPTGQVSIVWIIDKGGVQRKRYQVSGFKELVHPSEMIHVLNFTYDGIIGVSTLTHARQSLGIATESEAHAAGFFKSGGNTTGILNVEGRLSAEQKEQIYAEWAKRMNPDTGTPRSIAVLQGGMTYQPIAVSPKDAQLLESRQFNVVDICRFFSVSPVKAFDLTKNSYSTLEATQLEYLTDTAMAIITKFELELNRKIFLPSERGRIKAEFNTSALLRTDKAAQSAFWQTMFNIGGATPNEIRRENNLPRLPNGDNAFVQVNVQTLERAIETQKEKNAEIIE